MDVRDWAEGRFRGWPSVEKPGDFLVYRHRIQHGKLRKNVMRMLMIDQRLAMKRFTGLE